MTFVDAYFKHRSRYGYKPLGEAFCNMFFTGPYLHKTQQKLFDEKDDFKAKDFIHKFYNDLNRSFDGDIYDETHKT